MSSAFIRPPPTFSVVTVNPIFLVTFLARVSHSGKELYKRFLSIPGTTPNPSQGGDLDVGADPDIEIFQENVKLPHLEGLCLHLGDHTRDNDDVNHVSIFNHRLPLHFCTCTVIEWSLAQIREIGSPRRQFNRFRARVFSTPCICTIKQCLHHTT